MAKWAFKAGKGPKVYQYIFGSDFASPAGLLNREYDLPLFFGTWNKPEHTKNDSEMYKFLQEQYKGKSAEAS